MCGIIAANQQLFLLSVFRFSIKCSYASPLRQGGQHDDGVHPLLPHSLPEVSARLRQGALSRHIVQTHAGHRGHHLGGRGDGTWMRCQTERWRKGEEKKTTTKNCASNTNRDVAGIDVVLLALQHHPGGVICKQNRTALCVSIVNKLSTSLGLRLLKISKGRSGADRERGGRPEETSWWDRWTHRAKRLGTDSFPCFLAGVHSWVRRPVSSDTGSGKSKCVHTRMNTKWPKRLLVTLGPSGVKANISLRFSPWKVWNSRCTSGYIYDPTGLGLKVTLECSRSCLGKLIYSGPGTSLRLNGLGFWSRPV